MYRGDHQHPSGNAVTATMKDNELNREKGKKHTSISDIRFSKYSLLSIVKVLSLVLVLIL